MSLTSRKPPKRLCQSNRQRNFYCLVENSEDPSDPRHRSPSPAAGKSGSGFLWSKRLELPEVNSAQKQIMYKKYYGLTPDPGENSRDIQPQNDNGSFNRSKRLIEEKLSRRYSVHTQPQWSFLPKQNFIDHFWLPFLDFCPCECQLQKATCSCYWLEGWLPMIGLKCSFEKSLNF